MVRSKFYSIMVFMIIVIIFLIIPEETTAQSLCLHRNHDQLLTVEVIKPNFKQIKRRHGVRYSFKYFYDLGYPAKFYNGVWYPIDYSAFNSLIVFISYRRPFSNKLLFMAELPYARTDFDIKIADGYAFFRYNGHETSFGNPYLGLEVGRKTSWFAGAIGIRLPIISDEYVNITDICANSVPDRLEAFHQYASINMTGSIRLRHRIGLGLQLKSGFIYFFEQKHHDLQIWHIPSTLLIGYDNDRMSFKFLFHLRLQNIYEDYIQSDGSAIIGLAANMRWGNIQPGAHLALSYYRGYRILTLGFNIGYLVKN